MAIRYAHGIPGPRSLAANIVASQTVIQGQALKYVAGKIQACGAAHTALVVGVAYQASTVGNSSGTTGIQFFDATIGFFNIDCTPGAASTTSAGSASNSTRFKTGKTAAAANAWRGASIYIDKTIVSGLADPGALRPVLSSTSAGVFVFTQGFGAKISTGIAYKYIKHEDGATAARLSSASTLSPSAVAGKVKVVKKSEDLAAWDAASVPVLCQFLAA